MSDRSSSSALVLSGGGARTAYQAGVLQYVAHTFPEHAPHVITGSGMGGVNAALWAGGGPTIAAAAERLVQFWDEMTPERVFEARSIWDLVSQLMHHRPSENQSLLDLSPLRRTLSDALATSEQDTLSHVSTRIATGRLRALALTTSRYATGQTVTWVQSGAGTDIDGWKHAHRRAADATLTLDHVVAAASLALLFPAVQIGEAWHGAGVGMLHPLAPAVRLGADRLLVISTRPAPSPTTTDRPPHAEPDLPASDPYPSPCHSFRAQQNLTECTGGKLLPTQPQVSLNIDRERAANLNVDIADTLGSTLRYLHAEEAHLPDLLSVLLYAPDFVRRCLLLGYTDAEQNGEAIGRLLGAAERK